MIYKIPILIYYVPIYINLEYVLFSYKMFSTYFSKHVMNPHEMVCVVSACEI